MDAVLTDDLKREMKNVRADEKYVQRKNVVPALFFGRTKLKNSIEAKPEQVPSDLPQELHGRFKQLAEKYENNFQGHFREGPPHPGSYLGTEPILMSYEMSNEPQILLPVPASLLFEIVSKYQQAHKADPAFVDVASKKSGAIPTGLSYIDPFPEMIPATVMQGGPGAVVMAAGPAAVAIRQPGYPASGTYSLGVQSPPPPLRPDNLPPPPYISPLVVDKDTDKKDQQGTAPTPAK